MSLAWLPVPLCALPEQPRIVRLLDEQFEPVERNERAINYALRRSAALRQSPLHRALTGPLVTQPQPDAPAFTPLARPSTGRDASQTPTTRSRVSAS